DHAPTAANRFRNQIFRARAVRTIVRGKDDFAFFARERANRFAVQPRMALRAVEVDDKPRNRGGEERRPECRRPLTRQEKGAEIIPTVRLQRRLQASEITAIARRNAIATVLAGDDNAISQVGVAPPPLQRGQLPEHRAGAFAPFLAERREVRIALVEAPAHPDDETVAFVADEVARHADGQLASHRGVERDQHALGGFGETRGRRYHAVDYGLSVFRLAGLEEGRVVSGLDEIAFGIDAKQPSRLTFQR